MPIHGPFSKRTSSQDQKELPHSPSTKSKQKVVPDSLVAPHGWSSCTFPSLEIPGHPLHHDPNEIMAAHGWITEPLPPPPPPPPPPPTSPSSETGVSEEQRHHDIMDANAWSHRFWSTKPPLPFTGKTCDDWYVDAGHIRHHSF